LEFVIIRWSTFVTIYAACQLPLTTVSQQARIGLNQPQRATKLSKNRI
jgi:hypothetical protein